MCHRELVDLITFPASRPDRLPEIWQTTCAPTGHRRLRGGLSRDHPPPCYGRACGDRLRSGRPAARVASSLNVTWCHPATSSFSRTSMVPSLAAASEPRYAILGPGRRASVRWRLWMSRHQVKGNLIEIRAIDPGSASGTYEQAVGTVPPGLEGRKRAIPIVDSDDPHVSPFRFAGRAPERGCQAVHTPSRRPTIFATCRHPRTGSKEMP